MLQTVDKRMATACALKEERLLHDQLASSEERQDRSTDVAEAVLWTDTVRDYRQGRSHTGGKSGIHPSVFRVHDSAARKER